MHLSLPEKSFVSVWAGLEGDNKIGKAVNPCMWKCKPLLDKLGVIHSSAKRPSACMDDEVEAGPSKSKKTGPRAASAELGRPDHSGSDFESRGEIAASDIEELMQGLSI
jgi:hypothetical protein